MSAVTITVLRFSICSDTSTDGLGLLYGKVMCDVDRQIKSINTKATYSAVMQMLVQHG
jgi:hypothetical protein